MPVEEISKKLQKLGKSQYLLFTMKYALSLQRRFLDPYWFNSYLHKFVKAESLDGRTICIDGSTLAVDEGELPPGQYRVFIGGWGFFAVPDDDEPDNDATKEKWAGAGRVTALKEFLAAHDFPWPWWQGQVTSAFARSAAGRGAWGAKKIHVMISPEPVGGGPQHGVPLCGFAAQFGVFERMNGDVPTCSSCLMQVTKFRRLHDL